MYAYCRKLTKEGTLIKKILLILESGVTAELLTEALAGNHIVSCAPAEAPELLARFRPDLLLLDLFLPGTDGLSLLERHRDLLPPAVLGLSRLVTRDTWEQASRLGVEMLALKPCTVDYIADRISGLPAANDPERLLLDRLKIWGRARSLSALAGALGIARANPDFQLTKDVYPQLCRDYGAGPEALDQAFRRMIRSGWNRRPETGSFWDTLFPGSTHCPGNLEFLTAAGAWLQKNTPPVTGRGQRLSEGCPQQTSVNVQDN